MAAPARAASTASGLKGDNLEELQQWLPKLVDQLKKNPMFRDVGSDVDESGLRQNIVIDRATASRLGITPAAVDDALYNAFGQRQVSTIYQGTNEYRVVVNALPSQTETPAALNQVYVSTEQGHDDPDHRDRQAGAGTGADPDQPRGPVHHHGPELQPRARRGHGRGAWRRSARPSRTCACRATSS